MKVWPNGMGFDRGQWSYVKLADGFWQAAWLGNAGRHPGLNPIWGRGATPEAAKAAAKPQAPR